MADKKVDELLSPFEKMKVQVANHESLVVLRCSMALVNHNIKDPLNVKTLFSKVKKHINITCVDIFKNVLISKDKLFGSSDNFETVFLKPSKVCLLQEMLASCASHVPKKDELSSFHATVTEHKFEVKANKNSLDFTNLCGQYFASDGTFVPKFQRKKHHVGLPFSVPGNLKCKDGDWLLVSMRFSIKANLQFGCEIHTAKVIREVVKEIGKKQKASTSTPMSKQQKVSQNVLVHSIFEHILTSSQQQMRMRDVQTYLASEMCQQLSEEDLFRLLVKFPALFHIHKESNKGIVSIKKFNLRSVTEYLTLGDNVKVVKKRRLQNVDVPASRGVEMAVKSSRTETIMNVTNLSGLLVLHSGAGSQETGEVLFKLDPKSENILSMPCSRGSFHNSISRSSHVTFNLQKKLSNKNMTEVKFGIVPGKHKDNEKAGHNSSKTKDPHGAKIVNSSCEVPEVDSESVLTVDSDTDVDTDSKLKREVVVTKLVFALLSKPPHQAQYNVSKLFYENFLGQGKMKDYFSIIQGQKQIFHLQDNKLGLQEDWLRHFVLLGDNMKVSTGQVSWASTNLTPTVEVSKKKSGNQGDTHLPQSITIKRIPVVLHPVSSEDPRHQHLDMKLDSGRKGTIHTFCKIDQVQFNRGTVTLSLHLNSVSKKSCIDFVISNGKKLASKVDIEEKGTDNQPMRSDKCVNILATSAKTVSLPSLPEELAAVQLIFAILSTGPVKKAGLRPKFDMCLEEFPKLWDINEGSVGLASSWVEAMLPLALNVTETETECPSFPTKVEARLTTTYKGHPKLIISNITTVMENGLSKRRIFKLSEGGPTFSIKCSAKAGSSLTAALSLNLSMCLKPMQETSQIILTATDIKELRTETEEFQSFEDAAQEDFDDEPDEPFLSSKSPNVITIGDERVNVETAEDALNVDNSEISSEAKKDKCILS